MKNQTSAIESLDRYIRARLPIIAITSHEEGRVMASIQAVAANRSRRVVTWTITQGLQQVKPVDASSSWQPDADLQFDSYTTREPNPALETILNHQVADSGKAVLWVMKDLHGFLGSRDRGFDPVLTRWMRDIASKFEGIRDNLILLSPTFSVPSELEKTLVLIDWPLPDTDELSAILAKSERDLPTHVPVKLNGNRERVIQALRGLTAFEAGSVLLNAVAATGELSDTCIPFIVTEKAQIVNKDRVLEFFDETVTMSQVGGLRNLKEYATIQRSAFSGKARARGLDIPKGVLLVGTPGTGKSLAAKAMAGGQMPLLRMDIGMIMGGHVGESEDNMRRALKLASAIAPCVLWIDEVEKALGGVSSSNETDGGTTMRVFGSLLTWMQENKNPVYMVCTANSTRGLKPEFLRRFDDIIFVDLPNHADRIEILKVHLNKRGYKAEEFDLVSLATALWGFSGSEIEKVVISAIKRSFVEDKDLTTDHLTRAAQTMVPVSVTSKPEVDATRQWAVDSHAIQASDVLEPQPRSQVIAQSRTVTAEL